MWDCIAFIVVKFFIVGSGGGIASLATRELNPPPSKFVVCVESLFVVLVSVLSLLLFAINMFVVGDQNTSLLLSPFVIAWNDVFPFVT